MELSIALHHAATTSLAFPPNKTIQFQRMVLRSTSSVDGSHYQVLVTATTQLRIWSWGSFQHSISRDIIVQPHNSLSTLAEQAFYLASVRLV